MKLIYSLIAMVALSLSLTIAQETVQVDITKLTQEQLRVYQQLKSMQQSGINIENLSPEKIDKYAQIGKAFGSAFKECWSTVSTDAEKFAQSPAGKWAMVLVSWKIMGDDAVQLTKTIVRWLVGCFLIATGIPFWIWIVKRNCVNRPIESIEKLGFWKKKIIYKNQDPIHAGDAFVYAIVAFAYIVITSLLMFV